MKPPDSIGLNGERIPVIGRRTVNGRTYLVLEELGATPDRLRFRVFDPNSGIHGEERRLLVLPRNATSERHLKLLQRARHHDNLYAQILDLERHHREMSIVMDWVPGPTLDAYLTGVSRGQCERPSLREAYRLGRNLAHGLRRLHRKSFVVHGDLNPENLILHRDSGRLVLIDFGSAWGLETSTHRGPGDGNRSIYTAPELINGEQTPQEFADQFVATLILYQLLTLVVPYEGLGGKAGWPQHRDEMADSLLPPSGLHPDFQRVPGAIRDGVDRVVMRGLSLSVAARYPTSQAWLDDLDRLWFLMNEPQQRGGQNDRVSKWISTMGRLFGMRPKE